MTRNCLDLFSGRGGFSAAFEDSDNWTVITVELDDDFDPDVQADVMELRPSDFDTDFDVVLASPPCTYFSTARNLTKGGDPAWKDGDPQTDKASDHLALIHHTVGLIRGLSPDYWFLENPRGMLRKRWKRPQEGGGGTVWYCQYGFKTAKPTDLWGDHPKSFDYQTCHFGNDDCHHQKTDTYEVDGETRGGSVNRQGLLTETDASKRAEVPYGLSKSILDAVESIPEQTGLDTYKR
jgi:site-specific DNA-cytosine methylase